MASNNKFDFVYEHGSPFQTPSNSKPAQVVGGEWNNNEKKEPLDEGLEEELRREQLEDSFVDEELDLVDDDGDVPVRQQILHEGSAPPPCYSPGGFVSKKKCRSESQEATVLELSKLVNTLSKKSRLYTFLTSKWALLPAFLILFTSVLLSGYGRPYCTPDLKEYVPCVKCPPHAVCNFRKVVECVGTDSKGHNLVPKDGIVCVRNDRVGNITYALSQQAKEILEEKAWPVDCVGVDQQKEIPFTDLRSLLVSKDLQNGEIDVQSNDPYNTALNNLKDFLKENGEVFHIRFKKNGVDSYHFSRSPINCLTSKHAIQYARNLTAVGGSKLKSFVQKLGQEFENIRDTRMRKFAPNYSSTSDGSNEEQDEDEQITKVTYEEPDDEEEENTHYESVEVETKRHYDPHGERVQILSQEVIENEAQYDVRTEAVYKDHVEHIPKKIAVEDIVGDL